MIHISYNPKTPDSYTVTIFTNGVHLAGGGTTIEAAYLDALKDQKPYTLIHSCKTKADFYKLKQTHPELFL